MPETLCQEAAFISNGGDLPNASPQPPKFQHCLLWRRQTNEIRLHRKEAGSCLPWPAMGYSARRSQGFLASSLSSESKFVITAMAED